MGLDTAAFTVNILLPDRRRFDKRHGLRLKTTDIPTACLGTDEIHELSLVKSNKAFELNSMKGKLSELTLLRSSAISSSSMVASLEKSTSKEEA
jgi:hypothetical protein